MLRLNRQGWDAGKLDTQILKTELVGSTVGMYDSLVCEEFA